MLSQDNLTNNVSEKLTKKDVIFKYVQTDDLENLKRILFEGNKENSIAIKDYQDCNLLHRALESCESDSCVHFLLEMAPQLTKEKNNKGETPLLHACDLKHTNLDTLQLLVQTDPSSINVPDNNGCTPLHKVSAGYSTRNSKYYNVHSDATKKAHYLDRALFLIHKGAQINFEDKNGFSALHYSIQSKCDIKLVTDMKIIELLVKYGGKFYSESRVNALILANNSYEVMEYILKQDASGINHLDSKRFTPLNYVLRYNSCEANNEEIVTLLLKAGAQVDNKTIDIARNYDSNFSVVKLLMAYNPYYDIETKDENGRTLLTQYAIHGEDIRTLLKQGANVTSVDNNGSNALFTAVSQTNVSISTVNILLEAGVDPLQINKNNRNILSFACENFTSNPTNEYNLFKMLQYLLNLPCFTTPNINPPLECNNDYHPQYLILTKLHLIKNKINAYKILELILKSNWKNPYLIIVSYVDNFEDLIFSSHQKLNPVSYFLNSSIDILINTSHKNLLKKEVENILNLMINLDFIKNASNETVSPLSIVLSVIHQVPLLSAIYHTNDNEEENYYGDMHQCVSDSDNDDQIEYDPNLVKNIQKNELMKWVQKFIEHEVNVEEMCVELDNRFNVNIKDIDSVNLRRLLCLPDSLWVAFVRNNAEAVKILLPYWSQPPLALFLFHLKKDYNDIMKFLPLFLQYGGIPHGTQVSKCLQIFLTHVQQKYSQCIEYDAYQWDMFSVILNSPASLRDLSRHSVRTSLAALATKPGVSFPDLLTIISPPPGLKEYLFMQY